MKHIRGFAASVLALGFLVLAPAAQATPITYTLSGKFQNSTYYTGAADGGSFSGTFAVAGLPITPPNTGFSYVNLSSFDIVLKNSLGQTVLTFLSGVSGESGYISAGYETLYGGDFLQLADGKGDYLFLLFSSGFTGVGSVTPSRNGYVSDAMFGGSLHNDVNLVASGAAARAIPEPSTVALFGPALAVCGVFLVLRRRRRPAALAAA